VDGETAEVSVRGQRSHAALTAIVLLAGVSACQDQAPRQLGASFVYVAGYLHVPSGERRVAIRLDRQACFSNGRLNFRDASGLGVLVVDRPNRGWAVRQYSFPQSITGARGFVNVAGVPTSYPLVRGVTRITRADSAMIEGDIDWTLGESLGEVLGDTVLSRLRAVGRFSAVAGCDI
jgi:hypothetical protein